MTRVIALIAICIAACSPAKRGDGNGDDGSGALTCPRCSPTRRRSSIAMATRPRARPIRPAPMACARTVAMPPRPITSRSAAITTRSTWMRLRVRRKTLATRCSSRTRRAITVHIDVEWNGQSIDLAQFAKLPTGTGQVADVRAVRSGRAASQPESGRDPVPRVRARRRIPLMPNVDCPVPAAIGTDAQISGTGYGHAFHITTDLPVVAYQMLPYGGGRAAATGASLLLPTSAWSTNYVAVEAYDTAAPPIAVSMGPSMNIVAMEDVTTITMRPKSRGHRRRRTRRRRGEQPYTFIAREGAVRAVHRGGTAVGHRRSRRTNRSACSAAIRSCRSIAAAAITASRCSRRSARSAAST